MNLSKNIPYKVKLLLLVLGLAMAIPTVASAGLLDWWWSKPPTAPVQDVNFASLPTSRSRVTDIYLQNNSFDDLILTILQNQALSAQVASEVITVAPFTMTAANGDTVDCTVSPANLTTDCMGSTFRANVAIDVVTTSGGYSMRGRISGRITEENGLYNLRSCIHGVNYEDLGNGTKVFHSVRINFSGAATVPTPP